MKGLYKRALEIKNQSQANDDESHITAEERAAIDAEMEQVISASRGQLRPETLSFVAKRRGASLPVLINVIAGVLLAASVPLLLILFDAQEDNLVQAIQSPVGAEGQLLATLRQEAERQLARKDREIAEGVARAEALQAESDRLRTGMADRIRQREIELEEQLQARLASEAERLAGRTDQAEVQRRLADLETRLRDRFEQQLATFADREEAQVGRQVADLEALIQSQARDIERANAEVARLAEVHDTRAPDPVPTAVSLAPLSFSDRERLALDQVRAGYQRVMTQVQRGDLSQAVVELDRIVTLLASESFTTSSAVRDVAQLERSNVDTLREAIDRAGQARVTPAPSSDADRLLANVAALTDQADRRLRAGDTDGAESLYESALAEIPSASRGLDQIRLIDRNRAEAERMVLRGRIQGLETEVAAQAVSLAELEAADTARRERAEEFTDSLAVVRKDYRDQSRSVAVGDIPDVITLLRVKAELREKMDSSTVRAMYPNLYSAMESYLDQVSRLKEHTAEQTALQGVLTVLLELLDRNLPTEASVDLFEAILDGLEELVRLP